MSNASRTLAPAERERVSMRCPNCHARTTAADDSTLNLAWYQCACGEEWGARLSAGVPDQSFGGIAGLVTRRMMRAG